MRHAKRHEPVGKVVCRFLAGLCAMLAVFTGSYMVWRAWGQGLDTAYSSHVEETAVKRTVHRSDPDKVARLNTSDPPIESEPADGAQFAWVRVPSWSPNYRLAAWEGTERTILDKMGAGHYRGSAMPGGVGNSVWAGHNNYADFADIRLLKPGQQVIIETAEHWYVYQVNADPRIVEDTATEILDPDAAGATRGITLQTCWPILGLHVHQRLIVTGSFIGWADKADGVPEQLAQTHDSTIDRVGRELRTVTEATRLPMTGVLACCAGGGFLVADLTCILLSRRRWLDQWAGLADPMTWTWRLCAGVWQSNHIVYTTTRLLVCLLFWLAVTMLSWWLAFPALAGRMM